MRFQNADAPPVEEHVVEKQRAERAQPSDPSGDDALRQRERERGEDDRRDLESPALVIRVHQARIPTRPPGTLLYGNSFA
jgi:hypothetical protein